MYVRGRRGAIELRNHSIYESLWTRDPVSIDRNRALLHGGCVCSTLLDRVTLATVFNQAVKVRLSLVSLSSGFLSHAFNVIQARRQWVPSEDRDEPVQCGAEQDAAL